MNKKHNFLLLKTGALIDTELFVDATAIVTKVTILLLVATIILLANPDGYKIGTSLTVRILSELNWTELHLECHKLKARKIIGRQQTVRHSSVDLDTVIMALLLLTSPCSKFTVWKPNSSLRGSL